MQFNLKLACFPGLLPVPNFYLESLSSFKDRLVSDFFFQFGSNIQKCQLTTLSIVSLGG